jgi:2-polyprenyl-3-methyl-5-hydroxy-6-metoxy-1,4-benzoquinol methylase
MIPNFQLDLMRDYPDEFDLAYSSSLEVIDTTRGVDYSSLCRNSPGLNGFNWENYLNLSSIRMVRALHLIRKYIPPNSRVLDLGAYFGNFSLMLAKAGFEVTAVDAYDQYGPCMQKKIDLMRSHQIDVLTFEELKRIPSETFGTILLMGVIEHIPNTPRLLLKSVFDLLNQSGLLILDTPNLGYIYNRQKLDRGESIFPSIRHQFWTELPFEGHHREFTVEEVSWMLDTTGFVLQEHELFNYSLYGLSELSGIDLDNYQKMLDDPSMRELQIHAVTTPIRNDK